MTGLGGPLCHLRLGELSHDLQDLLSGSTEAQQKADQHIPPWQATMVVQSQLSESHDQGPWLKAPGTLQEQVMWWESMHRYP